MLPPEKAIHPASLRGVFLGFAIWLSWSASPCDAADMLATLAPSHPRLLYTADAFSRTRALATTDSLTGVAYRSLLQKAEQALAKPSLAYILDASAEKRLLSVSRDALERISLLAAMYRMDGDTRHLEGAVSNLKAVCAFPDWHPSHFLDVAEMTFAVALGYDWLHHALTPGMRDTLRTAIARHGLRPGMESYRGNSWWTKTTNNWNQVCNGGLAIGALAIAEDSMDLARRVLDSALASIPISMNHSYAPDGGYPEGLGYWEYGTNYNVYLLAALQSALGSTFGLLESPGFAQTADYRLQMVGPTNLRFNYSDQSATNNFVGSMFWFAKTFQHPFYARTERANPGAPNIFALLWYDPELADKPDPYILPTGVRYQHLDVAVFRSSWTDPNAWYVGFKGGDNKASHAHLDLGSFALEQGGVRWVSDLGADNYGVPNYFVDRDKQDGAHWRMYRTRTEGHSTLTIASSPQTPLAFASQNIDGKAPLLGFHSNGKESWAVADLTSGYRPLASNARSLRRVHRGARLWNDSQFLVQDEIESASPTEIVWNLVTEATVALQGRSMTLSRKGKTLRVEILAPSQASFDTVTCHPPDTRTQAQKDSGLAAENPNNGFTKAIIRLQQDTGLATIAVRFHPGTTTPPAPDIEPLARWGASNGIRPGRGATGSRMTGSVGVEVSTGRRIPLASPLGRGTRLVELDDRMRLVVVE